MATLLGCDSVEFAYADLDSGDGRVFELLQYHSPTGIATRSNPFDPGTPHVAVHVTDLDAVRARLAAAGTPRDLSSAGARGRSRHGVAREAPTCWCATPTA